jgi:hypothetical protein
VSSRISQLVDERDILDTVHRFAAGMDLREWDAYRSVFVDEIEVDYTSYRGGEVLRMAADAWVDRVRRRFATMIATQHMLTNHRIEIDGDEALCRTYLEAQHVALVDGVEDWCLIGGEYHDRLRRTPDGWKIVLKRLDVRWITGNRAILDLPQS